MTICLKKPIESTDLSRDLFQTLLISPRLRIVRHFLLLLFIFVLVFGSKQESHYYVKGVEWVMSACFLLFYLSIIYFNMYVLVPKLLLKDRYWLYLASVLLLLAFAFVTFVIVHEVTASYQLKPLPPQQRSQSVWFSFFAFTFVMGICVAASTTIKLLQRWILDSQRIQDLEKLNMKAELEQLKTQINPHFLLNMLNNVNVLTLKDPQKASLVIMVLSDLLRYQLYDTSRNKVLLTADIRFINDFLNLEKIRRDNFVFSVETEGKIENLQVPPLLFIPFIENATKHNVSGEKHPYVHIYFRMEGDDILHFTCINSKLAVVSETNKKEKEKGGLGLVNIKRRLELLFPDTHMLKIQDDEEVYTVNLSIKL